MWVGLPQRGGGLKTIKKKTMSLAGRAWPLKLRGLG